MCHRLDRGGILALHCSPNGTRELPSLLLSAEPSGWPTHELAQCFLNPGPFSDHSASYEGSFGQGPSPGPCARFRAFAGSNRSADSGRRSAARYRVGACSGDEIGPRSSLCRLSSSRSCWLHYDGSFAQGTRLAPSVSTRASIGLTSLIVVTRISPPPRLSASVPAADPALIMYLIWSCLDVIRYLSFNRPDVIKYLSSNRPDVMKYMSIFGQFRIKYLMRSGCHQLRYFSRSGVVETYC